MNSLEAYKDQCYNIGSPTPNPRKTPLSNLPRSLDSDFEFASVKSPSSSKKRLGTCEKSKIPLVASTRKRKSMSQDCTKSDSPVKKPRMMSSDEVSSFFEASMSKYMTGLSSKLDKVVEDNQAANLSMKNHVTGLEDQIKNLQASMAINQSNFESRLQALEGQVNQMQEEAMSSTNLASNSIEATITPAVEKSLLPKITNSVKKDLTSPLKSTWNAIQAEKVTEHEHSLIIFGLATSGNTLDTVIKFFVDGLKANQDTMSKVSVKSVQTLGKSEVNKPAPILVKFGHPSERNLILTHSKNLAGTRIKIEKHVPKNYQEQYKKFKNLAWKLKTMPEFDYMTQIIFDNHLLVLRYKKRDTLTEKYHWTIHSSWEPPMESHHFPT